MRYMGGKGRIAKRLAEVMLELSDKRGVYVEPFLGGGAVAEQMVGHFETAHLSDAHPDLILMWEAVANQGWEPPTEVSEDHYKALRHAAPSPERGFVGMGGSFGGKWFGGYARGGFQSNGQPRNHQAESARAVKRIAKRIEGSNVYVADFTQLPSVPEAPVIYCDPPYAGTTTYSTAPFDHEHFWAKATEWSDAGAHVFVSEYEAPEGWVSVWEQPLKVQANRGDSDRHTALERLFVRDGVFDLESRKAA